MVKNNYDFKTIKETALASGSAVAGLAIFGVGLSSIFNPVALSVVGAYATYKIGSSLLMSVPSFKNWQINSSIKKGQFEEVSEDTQIFRLSKEISDRLEMPEAPKVYTVSDKVVASFALPLGSRWLINLKPAKKFFAEKVMPKVFAAMPGANIIITTKEALAYTRRIDSLRESFNLVSKYPELDPVNDNVAPNLKKQPAVKA